MTTELVQDKPVRKYGMTDKHKQLQDTAIGWLYARGCSIFAKEVPTQNGVADALGIVTRDLRYGGKDTVYYIEAKASRSDLICLKQKCCYLRSTGERMDAEFGKPIQVTKEDTGVDFYYVIVADGITVEPELYPQWGVIDERGKVIRKAKRMFREKDSTQLIIDLAHVLVYKVFGKMYSEEPLPTNTK